MLQGACSVVLSGFSRAIYSTTSQLFLTFWSAFTSLSLSAWALCASNCIVNVSGGGGVLGAEAGSVVPPLRPSCFLRSSIHVLTGPNGGLKPERLSAFRILGTPSLVYGLSSSGPCNPLVKDRSFVGQFILCKRHLMGSVLTDKNYFCPPGHSPGV